MPDTVLDFLNDLEESRGNTIRTRNARLAALRSFVHYLTDWLGPELPAATRRILTIPFKRQVKSLIGFLTRAEIEAILAATDDTWTGRRDHLLILLLYNTGARISELLTLRLQDVLGPQAKQVELQGKGRNYAEVEVMQRCHAVGTNLDPAPTGICGASESTNALQIRPDLGLAMPEQSPAGGVVRRRMRGTHLDITPTPSVLGFVSADANRIEPVAGGNTPQPISAWPGCIPPMSR